VNRGTLKRVRRGGSPEKVAEAARILHDHGIELLVDLIVGLPGDTRDDVLRGMDFLAANGLDGEAQVFPLSLLPGTQMRATAEQDGVVFDEAPPYRVKRTATFSEEQLCATVLEAEDRLGRRLDEWPRPHLCAGSGHDVFRVGSAQGAGAQHVALWFEGSDLFGRRAALLEALDERLRIDPFATLDVVLRPDEPFPLDLLDAVRARLARAPQSYLSRALAHRGEDLQRRITVVLDRDFPDDFVAHAGEQAQVFRNQPAHAAVEHAAELGVTRPGARIVGDVTSEQLRALAERADADFVTFADRAQEQAWQERVLGFGDAR
jgi:hypothetical protein